MILGIRTVENAVIEEERQCVKSLVKPIVKPLVKPIVKPIVNTNSSL